MPLSLVELFRTLASFSPRGVDLRGAPWDEYVDWAVGQGLGPLAAYNLEYRLGGGGAPEWARDRLLAVYQGSANDNVMKLVNLKHVVGGLEGRRVVLLGAGSFAESLYPHVAFRPVVDLRLLVSPGEVAPLEGYLRRGEFKPLEEQVPGAARTLSDGRTTVLLFGGLTGAPEEDEGLLRRALPVKVFGPSMFRLDLEDALLAQALLMARAGFDVPMLELIDLRELVRGAPELGHAYSRPVDQEPLLRRAKAWGAERALWAALTLVSRLFPEVAEPAEALRPPLGLPLRELLERAVVAPLAEVGRTRAFKGEDALRALLAG